MHLLVGFCQLLGRLLWSSLSSNTGVNEKTLVPSACSFSSSAASEKQNNAGAVTKQQQVRKLAKHAMVGQVLGGQKLE